MSGRSVKIGDATPRWDARQKVAGAAIYGMDEPVPHALYAFLVTSAIARGHIVSIDDRDSRAVLGVVDILTYRNVGERIKSGKIVLDHGYMGTSIAPLSSNKIWHDGQIVAMVVAETFESAREAAHRLQSRLSAGDAYRRFRSRRRRSRCGRRRFESSPRPEGWRCRSPRIMARTRSSKRYTARRRSTIIRSSCSRQFAPGMVIADDLGVEPKRLGFQEWTRRAARDPVENIRVISPFVGGAFGSRGSLTQRTAIVALAAKRLGRPVKLEATRTQGFTIATYRAETRHRIELGATPDGKLCGAHPRRLGGHFAARQLQRLRHRRFDAALCLPQCRVQSARSCMPTATRRASCARRRKCLTCSRSKARWTNSPMR